MSAPSIFNFIHFSDIHFGDGLSGEQFDRDKPLREGILRSLDSRPIGCDNFDGVLIAGDIACTASLAEYERADLWLGHVCEKGRCQREAIYVVPGNHDVERSKVLKNSGIWNGHELLRRSPKGARHERLEGLLKSKDVSFLSPFDNFNKFAMRYECCSFGYDDKRREHDICWSHTLGRTFQDGTKLSLHGLNSALISDSTECDEERLLFVSEYQRSNLNHANDAVRLVLCHHPPSWLCDGEEMKNQINNTCNVMLYGHDHIARIERHPTSVSLFSGAVHPSRNQKWEPCFHFLQLEMSHQDGSRHLRVRIHTRVWCEEKHAFIDAPYGPDQPIFDELLPLSSTVLKSQSAMLPEVQIPHFMPNLDTSELPGDEDARRVLVVHFFGLALHQQITIARNLRLWNVEERGLPDHILWTNVLNRADSAGRLKEVWNEVAKFDSALQNQQNPFK